MKKGKELPKILLFLSTSWCLWWSCQILIFGSDTSQEKYTYDTQPPGFVARDIRHVTTREPTRSLLSAQTCPPRGIVFIKTHKAASSTITGILQRYGLARNKTFALPIIPPFWRFELSNLFTADLTMGYKELRDRFESWEGFDILVNHARLNKPEMDKVVRKNAFYLTIMRHPISHFESAFGYFDIANNPQFLEDKDEVTTNETDAIAIFLSNPKFFFDNLFNYHYRDYLWNGQAWDLGLDRNLFENMDYVNGALLRLKRELDLVLLKEYFDESLILLKKELCFDYQDIIYFSHMVRGKHKVNELRPDLRLKIAEWNKADMILYEHFNQTFWKKVQGYGPTFANDLEYFRELNQKVDMECRFSKGHRSATFPKINCEHWYLSEDENGEMLRELTKRAWNITSDVRCCL